MGFRESHWGARFAHPMTWRHPKRTPRFRVLDFTPWGSRPPIGSGRSTNRERLPAIGRASGGMGRQID